MTHSKSKSPGGTNFKDHHALIIGVGADLPVTANDAQTLAEFLTSPRCGSYDANKVVLLTETEATASNITKALDRLIKLSQDDSSATVLIYYSGHGQQYTVDGQPAFYLKPYGYKERDRDKTMLRGSLFAEKINGIKASKLMVLLDCCHADGMNNEKEFFQSEQPDQPKSNLIASLQSGQGRIFMSSCDDKEKSLILKGAKNSLFTEVLMEGLQGISSGRYPFVHAIDLMSHILRAIPERLEKMEVYAVQNPVISEIVKLDTKFFICPNTVDELIGTDHYKENAVPDNFKKNEAVVNKKGNVQAPILFQGNIVNFSEIKNQVNADSIDTLKLT